MIHLNLRYDAVEYGRRQLDSVVIVIEDLRMARDACLLFSIILGFYLGR